MKTGQYINVVIDTFAWIEYFNGTTEGIKVKDIIIEAEYVYTPSIVLAELARKYFRSGVDYKTIEERLKIIEELSIIVGIDSTLALKAAEAYFDLISHTRKLGLKSKPGLGDALILATARLLKAKVVTGDQHFKGLKETIWIG